MKNFWKIGIVLCSFVLMFFLLAPVVFGQTDAAPTSLKEELNTQMGQFAGKSGIGYGPPADVRIMVALIIKMFLTLIGTIFTAYLVYGGFLITTSAGDEEKITKAKHIVTNGVIGIAIVLSSWGIAWLVYGFIGFSMRDNPLSEWGTWSTTNLQGMEQYSQPNYDPNLYTND